MASKNLFLTLVLVAALTFLLSGCGPGGSIGWSRQAIDQSKKRGDAIIAAVRRFQAEQGHYPAQLAELVPKYLPQIDPPVAGNGVWIYRVHKGGKGFSLVFEGDSFEEPKVYWSSSSGEWDMDDKEN